MTISAVIPAAGCGARAALNGNKILAPLLGKPLLWWTIRALAAQTEFAFDNKPGVENSINNADSTKSSTRNALRLNAAHLNAAHLIEIVLAVRDEEREIVREIYRETGCELPLVFAVGGATRAASVSAATEIARGDFVLVHDAARPCLPREVTARVVRSALGNGAAIAALPADDTVKQVVIDEQSDESGAVSISIFQTLERSGIFLAQTPQMFRRELLQRAFAAATLSGWQGTDCASYVEQFFRDQAHRDQAHRDQAHRDQAKTKKYDDEISVSERRNGAHRVLNREKKGAAPSEKVAIVRGDSCNMKVTYADDLNRVAQWLARTEAQTN